MNEKLEDLPVINKSYINITLNISYKGEHYLLDKGGLIQFIFSDETGEVVEHSVITANVLCELLAERTNTMHSKHKK